MVRGAARRRRRLPVGVIAVLVITVFAVTALQAYVAQEGLRRSVIEKQLRAEEERLTLLRAKQAQLAAPSRVADEATKLGMVSDGNPTYLRGIAPERTPQSSDLNAFESLKRGSR